MELKTPVWLNALDRVLEAARKCKSLDELLHGGVLEQGRKAKGQAGDLFYLPVALVAFTRFGYLMRRAFFRLMLGDLNLILDGLTELEEKGVQTIDCRRAQFSEKEPILRLRMICQSWKVMFQAEYSSGQPLRMLVDLRASVEYALGRKARRRMAKQNQALPRSRREAAASRGQSLRRQQARSVRGESRRWLRRCFSCETRNQDCRRASRTASQASPALQVRMLQSSKFRARPAGIRIPRRRPKEELREGKFASGNSDRTDHLRRSRFFPAHHCPLADGAQRSHVYASER